MGDKDRWNKDFIKQQVDLNPLRVWVCGPSKMNDMFDKAFEEFGVGRNVAVIL
jgi:NAD(P)H-flavin reductase